MFHALRLEGHRWNHKRVWRVYCAMKLNQKRRAKRRLPDRPRVPLAVPSEPNHTWSFDFMSDTLYSGHRYRVLNIIDEGTREALDIVIGTSLPSGRVVRTLQALVAEHGKPRRIRVDNGAEMTAQLFVDWCREENIEIAYIQPGKPNQNAYIERFNRSFRTEVLDANIFSSLGQVRELAWAWLLSYNEERPHAALGNIPPAEFKRLVTVENSSIPLCA
jgi:putative transposase